MRFFRLRRWLRVIPANAGIQWIIAATIQQFRHTRTQLIQEPSILTNFWQFLQDNIEFYILCVRKLLRNSSSQHIASHPRNPGSAHQHHRQRLHLPVHADEAFINSAWRGRPVRVPAERMLSRTQLPRKQPRYLHAQHIHDGYLRISRRLRGEGDFGGLGEGVGVNLNFVTAAGVD